MAAKKKTRARRASSKRPAKTRALRVKKRPRRPATRSTQARRQVKSRKTARSRPKPGPAKVRRARAAAKPKIQANRPKSTTRASAAPPKPKPTPPARTRPIATRPDRAARPATLERKRRQLVDDERLNAAVRPDARLLASVRSGRDEVKANRDRHTETSPELTAGDVDAKWEDAYAVGDEAPGGDNPTPDQARVDDIGKALGIEYRDDEELQGGDEVTKRDQHRWELDPLSKDDDEAEILDLDALEDDEDGDEDDEK